MTLRRVLSTVPLLFLGAASLPAAEWNQHRGPTLDGRVAAPELGQPFRFESIWKRDLGSGYSGIATAGDRLVTLYSDGASDQVVAVDAATGKVLWQVRLAETYAGHDGSADGPIATPTIDDGRVFALGPRGQLLALALEDGSLLWSKDLPKDFASQPPFYGYSTSPLVVGDLLVVQTGGEDGHSVSALRKETGEVVWSVGEDPIRHQSPIWLQVEDEEHLIAVGATEVRGLDSATGRVLWRHRHSEKPGYDPTFPQITPIRGDRLLLSFREEARLLKVEASEGGFEVSVLWTSTALKESFAIPVVHGDHLYGFSGLFLTCVALETGEKVWKSRPPGGQGLVLAGDQLLVVGAQGWLTAIAATPDGYQESFKVRALDQGTFTTPTYTEGKIFVRDLHRLAAFQVVGGNGTVEKAGSLVVPESLGRGDFAEALRKILASEDKEARVQALLASHESFPVIEDGQVHFLYHGPAETVSILGQMVEDVRVPEALTRLPGTHLFHRVYPAPNEGRWQYQLQVDFDDPQADPRNPHRALGAEKYSEVTLPGFVDPDHSKPVQGSPKGRLETLRLTSEAYGDLDVRVYLPASYDGQRPHPLLLMLNGEQWLDLGLPNTFDHLFGRVSRSAVVAFVPLDRWVGGSRGGPAGTLLRDEVLPRLEATYRLSERSGDRLLWMVQDKSAVGLDLVAEDPDRFPRLAMQSPSFYRETLPDLVAHRGKDLRFFVGWSRYEARCAERGFDEYQVALDLRDWIDELGFEQAGGELVAGPGFRTWRLQAEDILRFLLPLH